MPQPLEFWLSLAMSLDGFIADAAGGVDWLEPFHSEELGHAAFLQTIDTLVMGRRTFEQIQGFGMGWPYGDRPCYVLSSRPLDSAPPSVVCHDGGIESLVKQLRREHQGRVWIVGGAKVARGFHAAEAIDMFDISIIPLVLGRGLPLFTEASPPTRLKLEAQQTFSNGVQRLVYRTIEV